MNNFLRLNKWRVILFLILPTFYVQVGTSMCKPCDILSTNCPPCIQPHFVVPLPAAIWSYISFGLNTESIFYLIIGLLILFFLVYFIFTILQKSKKPLVQEK